MTVTRQQEPQNLEEYSIETPCPPEFLPYESGAAAVSFNDDNTTNTDLEADGEFVRHGRSPRFWLMVAGVLVVVVGAVGIGVGVAMSGGSSSSTASPDASTSSSHSQTSVEEHIVEEIFEEIHDESKENKQTAQLTGGTVNVGSTGSGVTPAATSEVMDIILTHASYHGIEFQDVNSYQSKAAQWVAETAVVGIHDADRLIQRYALACIYYATNAVHNVYTEAIFQGAPMRGWIDETGWLDYDNECTWHQVTCDATGKVTAIELFSNRLSGALPPETALLKESLEVMDLYQNMLHNQGDIGNHFLGEMTNLRELFFGRTYFEYNGIPTAIGSLTKLEEFDCSYTLYHGPLDPDAFRFLTNLEYLHMGGNRYNSTIPSELASLPKLEFLYAEYADIKGDLSWVQDMKEIVELWVDRNPMIEGTIPTEIALAESLQSFSVTGCSLTGTIPTELASLRLHQFWAYNNSLTGTIPTEFANLDTLVRLGLEKNDLTGDVSAGICANRVPNGLLAKFETDCEDGGSVTCSCCTCCGPQCSS